jgi:hypothetical protein
MIVSRRMRKGYKEINIYLYNYIYNIQFTKSSKAVAFADDLILAIRNETIRAAKIFRTLK